MREFRSFLIMPGNNPGMLIKSRSYTADAVVFDLEDAVAPTEKDTARILVKETLRSFDFGGKSIMVRINDLGVCAKEDLAAVIPEKIVAVVAPKVNCADDVKKLEAMIDEYEVPGHETGIFAIIETAIGLCNVNEIAKASKRLKGILLGAEDLTVSIGAVRTKESHEIYTARTNVVIAARANEIQAIDTPFVDIEDAAGLKADCELGKQLGFTGKLCINPRQNKIVNSAFAPSPSELRWASRVVTAFEDAKKSNLGVVNVDGKMVDLPVVLRAERMLEQAKAFKLRIEVQ